MPIPIRRRWLLPAALCLVAVAVGMAVHQFMGWRLRQALARTPGNRVALAFTPLPLLPQRHESWGGGEVEALALSSTSLITAGGFGIRDESGDLSAGLPTLKATALCLWRGRPVAGLASGGVFLRREGRWEAFRTPFGTLHVRALAESPSGELWIGAKEGLFCTAWGSTVLERLDASPVRCLALGEQGTVLSGGEEGLRRIEARQIQRLATPDPWIDSVAFRGGEVLVCTPLGIAAGPLGANLVPLPGGQEATCLAVVKDLAYGTVEGRLLRFDAAGKASEEFLPAPARRVFAVSEHLFADTAHGLYRKGKDGWTLCRPRPVSLPPGPAHVSALAAWNGQLVLGFFDGGLALGTFQGGAPTFASVSGSAAWGVNALLPAGGVVYVASLRGTARFDGRRLESLPVAPGGSYAFARTADGLAIGTGQGLLLPDGRFLSAFHGLPGNQTLALASQGDDLFVGTPSGLGAVRGTRVAWRTAAGEGRLPHPWITALALHRQALFAGTYGGGVVRRTATPGQERAPGIFTAFPETAGMKINAGCLLAAGDRLVLGTEGQGLFVLIEDGSRFVALPVLLPSPRITALLCEGEWLYVGTDEGLARLPLRSLLPGA